jgi:hypothetical protein
MQIEREDVFRKVTETVDGVIIRIMQPEEVMRLIP